jgi:hypothetical protein
LLSSLASLDEKPDPSTMTTQIEGIDDWNKLTREIVKPENYRPASMEVKVPWKMSTSSKKAKTADKSKKRKIGETYKMELKAGEWPGTQMLNYFAKANKKMFRYAADRPDKKDKVGLDKVENEKTYAKNVLRVMKGKAHSKGLEMASEEDREKSLFAGSLISTSERYRSLKAPVNAYVEHYKVHHGVQELKNIYHPTKGTFIPARVGTSLNLKSKKFTGPGGAKQIRDMPPEILMKAFKDRHMKTIWNEYAKKKEGQQSDTFDEWSDRKRHKALTYWA